MKAFSVPDIRSFMQKLFRSDTFFGWQLRLLEMDLSSRFSVSGEINHAYLLEEEEKERLDQGFSEDYLMWQEVQEKAAHWMSGAHTPASLSITLARPSSTLPGADTEAFESLLLHIRFQGKTAESAPSLTLITALSEKSFTLDKSTSLLWDEAVQTFCQNQGIALGEA